MKEEYMNYKVVVGEGNIEGAPYVGALIQKEGVAKKTTPEQLIDKVESNDEYKGVIIMMEDFEDHVEEMLDMCSMLSNHDIRITLKMDDFYKSLEILGHYSARKQGMDLTLAEKMYGSEADLAVAIGGTLLDYYIKGDYYVMDKMQTFRVSDGVMYGTED